MCLPSFDYSYLKFSACIDTFQNWDLHFYILPAWCFHDIRLLDLFTCYRPILNLSFHLDCRFQKSWTYEKLDKLVFSDSLNHIITHLPLRIHLVLRNFLSMIFSSVLLDWGHRVCDAEYVWWKAEFTLLCYISSLGEFKDSLNSVVLLWKFSVNRGL